MTLSKLQEGLLREAREKLKGEPWFRGVCIDEFPTDEAIRRDREAALSDVIMTTQWHDAPDMVSIASGEDDNE